MNVLVTNVLVPYSSVAIILYKYVPFGNVLNVIFAYNPLYKLSTPYLSLILLILSYPPSPYVDETTAHVF